MLSIEQVYKEYSQMVYRYLLSLTRNDHLAEELTQETFYQAIRTIERFDGTSKVSTWLCGIAKNVWKTYQRKHPMMENLDAEISSGNKTEETSLANLRRVELFKKIHLLEGDAKEVVYLRLFGDLSFKEIGDILGKTENWARVTFYRGKERLRKELESDEA